MILATCLVSAFPADGVELLNADRNSGQNVLLEMRGIRKYYGNTLAVDGVDFTVRAGEVHGLLGQNGSGKSTLMKVAYGEITPSAGQVFMNGRQVNFRNPHAAGRAGIAAVAQEVPLLPLLSVGENVMLGQLRRSKGLISWRGTMRAAAEALALLDSPIDPRLPVSVLTPEQRQIVAIAHAVAAGARILILDEPTSSLSARQSKALFSIIRRFKAQGLGLVFISQRLQDVLQVADRITVMRDGLVAGELSAMDASPEVIIQLMIRRSLHEYFHRRQVSVGGPVLEVSGLAQAPCFDDVSFTVREGEVVGLTGLPGCGREEVLRAVYGAEPFRRGQVKIGGAVHRPRGPYASVKAGVGFATGDRKGEGLLLSTTVRSNLTLVRNRRLTLKPLRFRDDRELADEIVKHLLISPPRAEATVSELSGGNQQKVSLGKWFAVHPRVLLLEEPTRGIDVGAKSEIYRIIRELAAGGVGVVLSSADIPELLGLCDRVLVMFDGRLIAALEGPALTEAEVTACVGGG